MRIALIAMSGVRAHNPELTALGLTLPGFVERGRTIASLPSLGLLTLAALTPDRHEVTYHEVDDIADLEALPACDLAAFSTFSAQVKDAYALAERYRALGVPTVIGGLHVTALPEEALRHCDAVVVGEGERAWPRVLADAERGRLGGIYRGEGEFDLAEAPVPRFDLLEPERYNRLTVQTQRGCPWQCEFCASSILLTPHYKLKPVAKVIEEIRAIKALWDRPFIELADDNSFVHKPHARALIEAIAGEDVRWFTETDISVADDPELLALLRDSGCVEVLVGLESPNAVGLDGIELHGNWKRKQVDRYRDAIERIQSHGIAVNACFVLGLDGAGAEAFDAVESFVTEACPFDVQVTVMTAFPGTPLRARLEEAGRILREDAWELCTLFDVDYRPTDISVEDLESGFADLCRRIYAEEATEHRRAGFREQWRRGRDAAGDRESPA